MARRGRFRRKRETAPPPDGVTNEILTIVQAVKHVDAATAIDAETLEVTRADGSSVRSSIAELRDAIRGTTGLDRFELIEDFARSVSRPADTPIEDLTPIGELGPVTDTDAVVDAPSVTTPTPVVDERDTADEACTAADERTAVSDQHASWTDAVPHVRPSVVVALGIPAEVLRWRIAGSLSLVATIQGTRITEADARRWGTEPLNVAVAAMEWITASTPVVEPLAAGMRAWIVTAPAPHQAAWLAHPVALLDAVGLDEIVAFAATETDLVIIDPDDVESIDSIRASTDALLAAGEVTLTNDAYLLSRDEVRVVS